MDEIVRLSCATLGNYFQAPTLTLRQQQHRQQMHDCRDCGWIIGT